MFALGRSSPAATLLSMRTGRLTLLFSLYLTADSKILRTSSGRVLYTITRCTNHTTQPLQTSKAVGAITTATVMPIATTTTTMWARLRLHQPHPQLKQESQSRLNLVAPQQRADPAFHVAHLSLCRHPLHHQTSPFQSQSKRNLLAHLPF